MTDWSAFAGFAGVVLTTLLLLARFSQTALDGDNPGPPDSRDRRPATDGKSPAGSARMPEAEAETEAEAPPADERASPVDPEAGAPTRDEPWAERVGPRPAGGDPGVVGDPSTGVLLANVAVSQGALGTLLLVGAWYTQIPGAALGAGPGAVGAGTLAAGVALGGGLYVANETGAAVGRRVGFGGGEELRRALAPSSREGWAVLLLVVLPVIAGFEELLFRGVLVGAFAAGFGVSPWLLALASSVAFAAGHGAQGRVGVVVTGTLGFVLAAAFVVTGSLLTVVVAHYLVNALEFLVHEWAGLDRVVGGSRPG